MQFKLHHQQQELEHVRRVVQELKHSKKLLKRHLSEKDDEIKLLDIQTEPAKKN